MTSIRNTSFELLLNSDQSCMNTCFLQQYMGYWLNMGFCIGLGNVLVALQLRLGWSQNVLP